MAQFDESKVINALHTDKAEMEKAYWYANSLTVLKHDVEYDKKDIIYLREIGTGGSPFITCNDQSYMFLYPYEEPAKQKMTNRQLAEWLSKCNGERSSKISDGVFATNYYIKCEECEEVDEDVLIRPWGSEEWIEPTVDIYLRDCKHLSQDELEDTPYRDGC